MQPQTSVKLSQETPQYVAAFEQTLDTLCFGIPLEKTMLHRSTLKDDKNEKIST